MYILGFDIGGTKCAAITAKWDGENISIEKREACNTDLSVSAHTMIGRLIGMADSILRKKPDRIGISCGGPLDSERGIIMSPPNLPGWSNIEITEILERHYGVSAYLQNDANASALAEWKFGAGRGSGNMVFLTFGTGMGAGLILGGRLYEGTNGNAGEVGHIRLEKDGPVGFGKRGSFEGFCSGGGIAQLAKSAADEALAHGIRPSYLDCNEISARTVAEAARGGDPTALSVYAEVGKRLGRGLSLLIDILNPEKIVIGSIFERSGDLLTEHMQRELCSEALKESADVCTVLPAALGDLIGDHAAIAAAVYEGGDRK